MSALIDDEEINKFNDEEKIPRPSFEINSKDEEVAANLKLDNQQNDFGLFINYEEDYEVEQNQVCDEGNFLPEMIKDDEFEGDFDNN